MTHPGERVQIDVKVVPRRCIADPELKLYQYTAIDEFTRLRFLYGYEEQSTYSSADFVDRCVKWFKRHGITIECVQTDNGFEFTNRFSRSKKDKKTMFELALEKHGIRHKLIRPYTPQDPQKSVNWKATARTGELMVNTYAASSALRVRIYLDVSADPGVLFSDSFREFGISMAASLIRSLVKAQRDAALVVNCMSRTHSMAGTEEAGQTGPRTGLPSCVRFASCSSTQKLTAVEEFLTTDFERAPLCPFIEMLQRETDPAKRQTAGHGGSPGSEEEVFVFLSYADSPSLRAQIHTLLGTQHSGILAVPSRTADRRQEEQEKNLHILPVCNLS